MDHRGLIGTLTTEQQRQLTAKSDIRGLVGLVLHGGAIALTGTLIVLRVPFWPLLLLLHGVLIIFLFTLLHETIHRTAFRSGWLNDGVAHICGFLTGVQTEWFRYFHFAHHRHTQDPDHDPELASSKPQTRAENFVHVSGLPLWWASIKTLLKHATIGCTDAFVPVSRRAMITTEARLIVAGYGLALMLSVATGSTLLLFIWLLPVLLGQPFLRLYLLAEHGRCPLVTNMLANSRTTFTNTFVRRLAWNMPYHAEHHSYPIVPFHQLPHLHALACDHLETTEQGYGRFNRKYVAALEG